MADPKTPHESVDNLPDFITKIEELAEDKTEDVVLAYRGHRKMTWELKPSVLRNESSRKSEHEWIRQLIAWHSSAFVNDPTTVEKLARAQHYDLQTRLLDVTFNPLVALYFAVESSEKDDDKCELKDDDKCALKDDDICASVIVLRIKKERVRWYDSHRVACLANLAYLKEGQREDLRETVNAIVARHPADASRRIEELNEPWGDGNPNVPAKPDQPVVRLIHFLQEEMPYFGPRIDPLNLQQVLLVKPRKNSPRILVQDGAFLIWGLEEDELDTTSDIDPTIIDIPREAKRKIRDSLAAVCINRGTMYPEIHNAAKYLSNL